MIWYVLDGLCGFGEVCRFEDVLTVPYSQYNQPNYTDKSYIKFKTSHIIPEDYETADNVSWQNISNLNLPAWKFLVVPGLL